MAAARALRSVIDSRDEPIPFFGELSSLNPVLVTEAAAQARTAEIADGLFTSVTGSSGQLCTKPGIALVPADAHGDGVVEALAERVSATGPAVMLNERIRSSYGDVEQRLLDAGASAKGTGTAPPTDGPLTVAPAVLEVSAEDFSRELCDEAFGPLVLVVRYGSPSEALGVLAQLPGSLTATVQGQADEPDLGELLTVLAAKAGRVIFNGYPTGVRVSWAQHHGGPWPATDSQHSSVGVSAIRRWLRPVAWQNVPDGQLPPELRDGDDIVPRRVDGRLQLPKATG
jgi:NADP-dependent aldehyde dehydrogenase